MMFVDDRDFSEFGEDNRQIVGIVLQQHQLIADEWSVGLIVPIKHMKYRKYLGIIFI